MILCSCLKKITFNIIVYTSSLYSDTRIFIHPVACLLYYASQHHVAKFGLRLNILCQTNLFCFFTVSPIPEISPGGQDSVSAMCQQLSRGLSLLSSSDDFGPLPPQLTASSVAKQLFTSITANSPPGIIFRKLVELVLIVYFNQSR